MPEGEQIATAANHFAEKERLIIARSDDRIGEVACLEYFDSHFGSKRAPRACDGISCACQFRRVGGRDREGESLAFFGANTTIPLFPPCRFEDCICFINRRNDWGGCRSRE